MPTLPELDMIVRPPNASGEIPVAPGHPAGDDVRIQAAVNAAATSKRPVRLLGDATTPFTLRKPVFLKRGTKLLGLGEDCTELACAVSGQFGSYGSLPGVVGYKTTFDDCYNADGFLVSGDLADQVRWLDLCDMPLVRNYRKADRLRFTFTWKHTSAGADPQASNILYVGIPGMPADVVGGSQKLNFAVYGASPDSVVFKLSCLLSGGATITTSIQPVAGQSYNVEIDCTESYLKLVIDGTTLQSNHTVNIVHHPLDHVQIGGQHSAKGRIKNVRVYCSTEGADVWVRFPLTSAAGNWYGPCYAVVNELALWGDQPGGYGVVHGGVDNPLDGGDDVQLRDFSVSGGNFGVVLNSCHFGTFERLTLAGNAAGLRSDVMSYNNIYYDLTLSGTYGLYATTNANFGTCHLRKITGAECGAYLAEDITAELEGVWIYDTKIPIYGYSSGGGSLKLDRVKIYNEGQYTWTEPAVLAVGLTGISVQQSWVARPNAGDLFRISGGGAHTFAGNTYVPENCTAANYVFNFSGQTAPSEILGRDKRGSSSWTNSAGDLVFAGDA